MTPIQPCLTPAPLQSLSGLGQHPAVRDRRPAGQSGHVPRHACSTRDGAPALPVGNYRWGVYAFFDYDGEPIYVGQTNEQLRTRIRRHLTNQRTDAVAMSVLDPFEVFEIEVWPLPQFEGVSPERTPAARSTSTRWSA